MSTTMSPLDQGHDHANNATDFYGRGLLIPAAEEHYKAAEAFKTCVDQSTDEHTKNTLRKLYSHHNTAGKDLQRRIAKLKEDGKDPALPQLAQVSRSSPKNNDVGATHQAPRQNLDSSTNTFDESFMVLNQQTEPGNEDSPFDLFWKVTGEIMVNLSQPMSIQTAMAAFDAVENRSATGRSQGRQDIDQSLASGSKRSPAKSGMLPARGLGASRIGDKIDDFEFDEEDYDFSDDFCLVPSTSESTATATRLKNENAALKSRLENMEKQMTSVQKQISQRNEQDQQLRDNIMVARKEAQRAMAASTSFANPSVQSMMNLPGLNLNGPLPGGGRERETQLLRRIRELEEEVRTVRSENDKQKAMIAKFRERWERLKESAKRKKSAKAAGQSDPSNMQDRIDEDPEAEAAATAEDLSKDGS